MIQINNLVKNYGPKAAVKGISFSVEKGEIVGFLGPNGAGKSTTMNILTGYLSATDGEAKIAGFDVLDEALEARRHIGYLPEQPPLYLDMTVNEYLNFVYDLKKAKGGRTKHLREVCEKVRLSDVRYRLIKNLSKGYKQRVGIASALVGDDVFFGAVLVVLASYKVKVAKLVEALGKIQIGHVVGLHHNVSDSGEFHRIIYIFKKVQNEYLNASFSSDR